MSEYYIGQLPFSDLDIEHHGIFGQKWGVRRYQNEDGSLTPAGVSRYRLKQRDSLARAEEKRLIKSKQKAESNPEKAERDYQVGKARLEARIKTADARGDVDRLSAKTGWSNTVKAGEAQRQAGNIKKISNEILADKDRTTRLGQATVRSRKLTIGLTAAGASAATGAAIVMAMAETGGLAAIPLAAAGATIALGRRHYNKTFY